MTKSDIIAAVYQRMGGMPRKDVSELVDTVFGVMEDELLHGGNVRVSGFGNFTARTKAARMGRNPKTGEEIAIPARRVVTFKPSLVLRKSLNNV